MSASRAPAAAVTRPDVLSTRVLLLVEDNPGDADLVRELLDGGSSHVYRMVHVARLDDAVDFLTEDEVDVVLLDLRLPDAAGTDTVARVRDVSDVPIVVLTGTDDDEIALSCIDAGADDYLRKREIEARSLMRAIGFAITRRREAQIRELEHTLERYRQLSKSSTRITAMSAGVGSMRERVPDAHSDLARRYSTLLDQYLEQLVVREEKPRRAMEEVATSIGDLSGGPRDLLGLHVEALERAAAGQSAARGLALAIEGRLLALEMMGLLVDYYRSGTRRRHLTTEADA